MGCPKVVLGESGFVDGGWHAVVEGDAAGYDTTGHPGNDGGNGQPTCKIVRCSFEARG